MPRCFARPGISVARSRCAAGRLSAGHASGLTRVCWIRLAGCSASRSRSAAVLDLLGGAWLPGVRPATSDADLGLIGTCCNDDAVHGPQAFVDGESIADADLVFWYVPQMRVDADLEDGDGYSCWTVVGEPNPESHPCFAGPTFVPIPVPEPAHGVTAALVALAAVAARFRAADSESE